MATARRDPVERGLALKKAGNAIMEAVGEQAIRDYDPAYPVRLISRTSP